MHAILVSLGTGGDVFPYLGLGSRLKSRGHRVTLVTDEHYESLAGEHGFAYRALLSGQEIDELLADPDFWHPIKGPIIASRWGVGFIGRQYALLAEIASEDGAGDAVLVASPGVFAARLVQEKLSKPMASVILQPMMVVSSLAPPVMPGGFTLPRWAPRPAGKLYWRLIDGVGDLLLGRHLNRIRESLALKPVRRIFQWWLSPQLVIGMFPEWYGQPQADWPPQLKLAGFPLYDGRAEGSLSPELLEFCRAGRPPIAFTFGTGMMHAERWFRAALEGCRILGERGIFLTRYRHQLPASLPPFVRHCEFAPFQQLFPLCAAVVHHGGVGTGARALAAGAPQLIIPQAYDQPDNARRMKRLGVGDWLRPGRRSSSRIARALAELMTPQTGERCRAVAANFASQDALETAAKWVEELAHHAPGSRR